MATDDGKLFPQLEALIAKLSPSERTEVVRSFATILTTIGRHGLPISKMALVKFLGRWAIANASDDTDAFKRWMVEEARKAGPNVTAVFQALEAGKEVVRDGGTSLG